MSIGTKLADSLRASTADFMEGFFGAFRLPRDLGRANWAVISAFINQSTESVPARDRQKTGR